jgi:Na+/phosphate symporter
MGTSLSDQAWGRESAVYRVTGVLTVIGGWFFTAMMAFTVSAVFAVAIFFGKAPAVIAIFLLAVFLVVRTHLLHRKREKAEEAAEIFNLRKIKDSGAATVVTFEHAGIFLREVAAVLNDAFEGVFEYDRQRLRRARQGQRRIQEWSNIIAANIFKVLRLLQWTDATHSRRYAQTISSLQEISESVRDIVMRSKLHVDNQHSGLLDLQIEESDRLRREVVEILERTSQALLGKESPDLEKIGERNRELRLMVDQYDRNQIVRIQDNSSKTRLSILFYSLTWDCLKIAEQTTHLLALFREPLKPGPSDPEQDRPLERAASGI